MTMLWTYSKDGKTANRTLNNDAIESRFVSDNRGRCCSIEQL
jgi:hypothetical protein